MAKVSGFLNGIDPRAGSKRGMAEEIGAFMGKEAPRVYLEPFCGSLANLMSRPQAAVEIVCDLDGALVNLARVLANEKRAVDLYGRVSRTLCSEQFFGELSKRLFRRTETLLPARGKTCSADWAYEFIVTSWQGINGIGGTDAACKSYAKRYTTGGGSSQARFNAMVASIPWWHERLRRVDIRNECGIKLIERYEDKPGIQIYSDSPYLSKKIKYRHDFTPACHQRLADGLVRFQKAAVYVSYYDHPALKKLYLDRGFIKKTLYRGAAMSSTSEHDTKKVAPEVLLLNGPAREIAQC